MSNTTNWKRWALPGLLAVSLAGGITFGNQPVEAQDTPPVEVKVVALEVSRDAVKTGRREFVTRYMNFTPEESEKFWPVYESYQKDLAVPNQRLADLGAKFISNYPTFTEAEAKQILTDYLNAEKNILDRKRTYVGRFSKAISPKKVLRLYQLENRMDAAVSYDLAGSLPLVR